MDFCCETVGCGGKAKIGGKCVPCATKAAKEKYMPQKAETHKGTEEGRPTVCGNCERNRPERFNHQRNLCNSCNSMRHIKERLARQGNKSGQKPKRAYRKNAKAPLAAASREPGNIISPASPERLTLTVDFSAFPEIHARLLILAEEDMRPPELQLLYLLKNGLSELEGKA